jgi:hypothetical protein
MNLRSRALTSVGPADKWSVYPTMTLDAQLKVKAFGDFKVAAGIKLGAYSAA